MQRLFLGVALFACLAVAGCGPSASEKLVGKWEYDLLDPSGEPDGEQDTQGSVKEAFLGVAQAMGVKAGMQIEFREDKTLTMSGSLVWTRTTEPMEWKVAKVEGETITVEIRQSDGQDARKLEITLVNEDHFRFAPPAAGGKSLVFTRVKQE